MIDSINAGVSYKDIKNLPGRYAISSLQLMCFKPLAELALLQSTVREVGVFCCMRILTNTRMSD
jgi:hypothetical protein